MSDDDLNPPSGAAGVAGVVVVDGRDMQPPEPLEKTLAALDVMPPDGEVKLLVYCHPAPLFNILRNNSYAWEEEVHPDGTHEIRIHHA